MVTQVNQQPLQPLTESAAIVTDQFGPLGSRRLLALAGIAMILAGMIFGDIFAIFVLHQNAAREGDALSAMAHAALSGNPNSILAYSAQLGSLLENRGTKVDAHVHLIDFGYLALLMAILQPRIAFRERTKRRIAWMFVVGAGVLPTGVFLIHYIGLSFSPLASIGWASIAADLGGLLVLLAALATLSGLWKYWRSSQQSTPAEALLSSASPAARMLMSGGVLLVLLGFAHGAWYAATDLYRHEALEAKLLSNMAEGAASRNGTEVDATLTSYAQLQGDKAVNIAAHAHVIEFGLLAMMLSFFQPYIALREEWQRHWARLLLLGGIMLPVFVLLELRFGLLAGGIADLGGLLVVIALFAMWIGILRFTGSIDLERGAQLMTSARKIFVLGGLALAVLGMGYGLWYAVAVEHQTLDSLGGALTGAFQAAVQHDAAGAESMIARYRQTKYNYDRQVDIHSHILGLAILLIVLGLASDRINFTEKTRSRLAMALLAGSVLFPLGVLMETITLGRIPQALAVVGSAIVIISLLGISVGFARPPNRS